MSQRALLVLILLIANLYVNSFGQESQNNLENPYAVSTYESSGIYWETPESGACTIQYKEINEERWYDGLELVYDPRDGEYRGSIIKLKPNVEYEVKLSNDSLTKQFTFKTRSDNFPIGKKTILPDGETDKPVIITESGTPDAYHLVTVPDNYKSTLNLKNIHDNGIEIYANYVIVRGVEVRNARIHGIIIKNGNRDIVIEDSFITFWGRMGGSRTYGNLEGGMDSAIWVEEGAKNITIQRNLIKDPRGASNDWTTGHTSGPQGITFIQSKGGHVIRYNDIVSTEGHGFNDAIGGGSNYSMVGNMNRDSDIYGNYIRNVWRKQAHPHSVVQ